MKKLILASMISALVPSLCSADDINIWNWSDYIAENTVSKFEEQESLKANYTLFDSNELVEARLLSGHSGFDAVMMVSYYVPRLAQAGAIEKIDKTKIPNWDLIDKNRLELLAAIDPDNDYAYPYTEITIGIGYNKEKIAEIFGPDYQVDSWDFLFKKENSDKLKSCGIAVLESPIEIISAAMHYLGKDPASEKAADYAEAKALLTALASNTAYFHSSRYINDLAAGEVCAVIGYSGDILQAADRAKSAGRDYTIEYVYPKEGSLLWFDCWVVPAKASNYDNAMKWFSFLMQDEIAAEISHETRYILPVRGGLERMDEDLKTNPSINLSEEQIKKAYFVKPTSAKVSRITNQVWNSMKLNSDVPQNDGEEGSGWE